MILDNSAIVKLRDILAEENSPGTKLRVFVQGGGCSGMQYGFTLDNVKNEDDFDFDFDDVAVLVDSMSMGSSFIIDNPNAETTCGCGSSFNPG